MSKRTGAPPGVPGTITRRAAIGGMVAAAVTPTLIAKAWGATGGDNLSSTVQPPDPLITSRGGRLAIPRQDHTTTLLPDGRLLVVGGYYLSRLSNVQIYDPQTNTWTDAAPLMIGRFSHAAALMGDGSVLVAGGMGRGILSSTEIYDPTADTWTAAAPLNIPRYLHSATAMGDGSVLVAGGLYRGILSSVEIFNGNTWTLQ